MMKQIVIILGLLMLCLSAEGQSYYTVFSVNGNVQLRKSETSNWQAVEKRMSVALTDICRIPNGGSISIIDNETKLIYRSQQCGEMNISVIKEKATEQATQISRLIAEDLKNAFESGSKNSFTAKGSTSRGQDLDDHETTTEEVYTAIVNAVVDNRATIGNDDSLFHIVRKPFTDGAFYFSIMNCTDTEFVVTIVSYERSMDYLTPCFNSLLLPSGTQIDLEQFIFADDGYNTEWFFIASPFEYDITTLQTMLNNRKQYTAITNNKDSVFVMKI